MSVPETQRERYVRMRNDELRKFEHAVETCQILIQGINERAAQVQKLNKEIEDLHNRLEEADKNRLMTEEGLVKFIKDMRHYN